CGGGRSDRADVVPATCCSAERRMKSASIVRRLAGMLLPVLLAAAPAAADDRVRAEFPYPASIRTQVEFWKKIFGTYSENQIVLHDTENLGRVYAVLDFRDRADAGESKLTLELAKRYETDAAKERIRSVLRRLDARAGNDGGLDGEERRIWNLFAKDDGINKFGAAAAEGRVRAQPGLKERFARGVRISRRYLAEMEEI